MIETVRNRIPHSIAADAEIPMLPSVGFILRADNRGEGGIFALLGLIMGSNANLSPKMRSAVSLGAIFGAALLYGDGIITPWISVLSAVEGLKVATETAKPFIVPLTCAVLVALFLLQKRGTAGIGKIFGPVMILWFLTTGTSGMRRWRKAFFALMSRNSTNPTTFFGIPPNRVAELGAQVKL